VNQTYKFFTGDDCAPCKVLKERIEELGLSGSFTMLDVFDNVNEACKYHVRSRPHIVCSDGTHYIGLKDGMDLVNMLADLKT